MAKDNWSKLDFGQTLKASHQKEVDAQRVVNVQNVIDTYFSRAIPTYDGEGSLTNIKFYLDRTRQCTRLNAVADVSGSLNGTYFIIYSGGNRTQYYVWFNNGSAPDPAIPNAVGIEVSYANNAKASTLANLVAIELNMSNAL